ncbi:hypothetical protein C8R44DRAFT_894369 [Mycena epipterygia]|nr:hypothetical protein C8R44DRAFT_894369 [Mycena epipterygia]
MAPARHTLLSLSSLFCSPSSLQRNCLHRSIWPSSKIRAAIPDEAPHYFEDATSSSLFEYDGYEYTLDLGSGLAESACPTPTLSYLERPTPRLTCPIPGIPNLSTFIRIVPDPDLPFLVISLCRSHI